MSILDSVSTSLAHSGFVSDLPVGLVGYVTISFPPSAMVSLYITMYNV